MIGLPSRLALFCRRPWSTLFANNPTSSLCGAELQTSARLIIATHRADPMILICFRTALRSPVPRPTYNFPKATSLCCRQFNSAQWRKEDPRMPGAGREIVDEFAVLREKYGILDVISLSCTVKTNIFRCSGMGSTLVQMTLPNSTRKTL